MKRVLLSLLFLVSLAPAAWGASDGVRVAFMEPEAGAEKAEVPVYRLVTDPARVAAYTAWTANESVRAALDLYDRAWRVANAGGPAPVYYVALVPDGNHAARGFRLRTAAGDEAHERTAYIKLNPDEKTFNSTFLHETGHVVLSILNGGDGLPEKPIASIPHTTTALTDRGTAFNEGFAIHLETLAAHLGADAVLRERYHHDTYQFGVAAARRSEYDRQAMDLLTFAQTRQRYHGVRENAFAFASAFRDGDYLRAQLDPARDFAVVRDANQLLQSEGFYATFFFDLVMRGERAPSPEAIRDRQQHLLEALAAMFRSRPPDADAPYMLQIVEAYMARYPAEAGEVADVLLDLSHGVFVDPAAGALWRDHYLGALRLDLAERQNPKLAEARTAWRARVVADPKALYSRVGPQVPVEVPSATVRLVAFGEPAPLAFDANTAEEGVLRAVPGITTAEVERWMAARAETPFRDAADFRKRSGLSDRTLAAIKSGVAADERR